MDRKSKDELYLDVAEAVLGRATCLRRLYGAVIVKNDEIISTGYNGSPRGQRNCNVVGTCKREELHVPQGQRYELCLQGDTVVKLLNGTYRTISELAKNPDEKFWVYSIDTRTGEIVPAIAQDARVTGHTDELVVVTFDNGKQIKCTRNHKLLLRNCHYVEAGSLHVGQSIMPMYYNFSYDQFYESVTNKLSMRKGRMPADSNCNTPSTPTHHLVCRFYHPNMTLKSNFEDNIVHHKNGNPTDNSPENLELITRADHTSHHSSSVVKDNVYYEYHRLLAQKMQESIKKHRESDLEFDSKFRDHARQLMNANWNNTEFVKRHLERSRISAKKLSQKFNKDPDHIRLRSRGQVLSGLSTLRFKMIQSEDSSAVTIDNYEDIRDKYKRKGRHTTEPNLPHLSVILKYFDSFEEAWDLSSTYNHKVLKVEFVPADEDVYDISVPGFENFAVDLGDDSCIFVHNCVSIHAEQNAIISASRDRMIGSTLYLAGKDAKTGEVLDVTEPCLMCKRMIINAGIEKVITRNKNGKECYLVDDWVKAGDSL